MRPAARGDRSRQSARRTRPFLRKTLQSPDTAHSAAGRVRAADPRRPLRAPPTAPAARTKSADHGRAPPVAARVPPRAASSSACRSRTRVSCSASACARTCVNSTARDSSRASRPMRSASCCSSPWRVRRVPVDALRAIAVHCEISRRDRPRALQSRSPPVDFFTLVLQPIGKFGRMGAKLFDGRSSILVMPDGSDSRRQCQLQRRPALRGSRCGSL